MVNAATDHVVFPDVIAAALESLPGVAPRDTTADLIDKQRGVVAEMLKLIR